MPSWPLRHAEAEVKHGRRGPMLDRQRLGGRHRGFGIAPELVEQAGAVVVHGGKRAATAEGRLIGIDGKLYAHGTTTCMIFPLG